MWHHWFPKPALQSCPWKRHCIPFLLVWRVAMVDGWFITGQRFFFYLFLHFSLSQRNYMFVLCFFFSILILMFWMVYFCHRPFYKKNLLFQFSHSITPYHIFFSIRFLLFWFLTLTPGSFVRVLIVFNFILQAKFMFFFSI
jgi:hypothetical protein